MSLSLTDPSSASSSSSISCASKSTGALVGFSSFRRASSADRCAMNDMLPPSPHTNGIRTLRTMTWKTTTACSGSCEKESVQPRPKGREVDGFGSLRHVKRVTQTLWAGSGRSSVLVTSSAAGAHPGGGGVFQVDGSLYSSMQNGF
jgi:hypothetical protein